MALAVASTSTVTTTTASSVVVTKPSGVEVGDLLVIFASTHSASTFPTCSGFTSQVADGHGSSLNPQISTAILWRIADASDVSASNYTVSGAIATMFRITGWTSGNPIFYNDTALIAGFGSSTTVVTRSITGKRPTPSLMAIVAALGSRISDQNPSWSAYSVTSGESNPSWTEVQDEEFRQAGESFGGQAVAYANTSNLSDVTEWSVTFSGPNGATLRGTAFFIIIAEPQNVTADLGRTTATPSVRSVTASQVNVSTDLGRTDITPTIHGIDTKATAPQRWTNETKSSTTWTNETKS